MQRRAFSSPQEAYRPHPAHDRQYADADFSGLSQRTAGESGIPECDETSVKSCKEVYGKVNFL
jgi:hypothetical protein